MQYRHNIFVFYASVHTEVKGKKVVDGEQYMNIWKFLNIPNRWLALCQLST